MNRLIISKLELENFKSYSGTKTIGPLHSSFSAIVGPNGSGKSNLIESLIFVFGKKAKDMRLKKLSELIHSSKEGGTQNPYAQVTVFFEEGDSKFQMARRVDRNSNSIYYLDGNVIRYSEICQRLRQKGIDLDHNRFLIL